MTPLVTLAQAADHLRIDDVSTNGEPLDPTVALLLSAATAAVRNYLKAPLAAYQLETDTNGEVIVDTSGKPVFATNTSGEYLPRYEVKAAVLLMLGYLYKDRDNDANHEYETGYLPRPVTALLYPLRDPALA